ncbi:DUF4359 domain-containing protein [Geitlerinema sp. PCC 9228]|jgi:hypothetical protein|uniref:DUF4359 domain-containing protein n=1 Tax=Geitlerinema sp. PCC 9228 TaxID=111611 RepID=UPI0008F9AC6F|nr:DUF4359 domain-containing protein [Geitlerinema sp. PCC 9228]
MKRMKTAISVGGLAVVGLGIGLAVTNPKSSAYQSFAAKKFASHLQENVCDDVPKFLRQQCRGFADANRGQFQKVIADTTQRQNYFFFSIYETDISMSLGLPSYHFSTVGILNQFYIYEAEKKS